MSDQNGLFITNKMFGWNTELITRSFSTVFERMVSAYGFLLSRYGNGSLSPQAQVNAAAGPSITVNPFTAVIKDVNGKVRSINEPNQQSYDCSTLANGTYNVLLRYSNTYYEPGTVTLTYGSNILAGVGTSFTDDLEMNMYIVILDSQNGNNGVYQIQSITDDTHLVLTAPIGGTTEGPLPFAAGGYFPDDAYEPDSPAGYEIFAYDSYQISITTAPIASDQIYLAQVVKAGSVLTITDMRSQNVFALFGTNIDLTRGAYRQKDVLVPHVVDQVPGETRYRTNVTPAVLTNLFGLPFPLFNPNQPAPDIAITKISQRRMVYISTSPFVHPEDGTVEWGITPFPDGDDSAPILYSFELLPSPLSANNNPVFPAAGDFFRSESGIASIAGTPITFTTPFVAPNLYQLLLSVGITYINPTTQVDTRTTDGFTAFAGADNTPFTYFAVKNQ
jgi:hypothetical protein